MVAAESVLVLTGITGQAIDLFYKPWPYACKVLIAAGLSASFSLAVQPLIAPPKKVVQHRGHARPVAVSPKPPHPNGLPVLTGANHAALSPPEPYAQQFQTGQTWQYQRYTLKPRSLFVWRQRRMAYR